MWNVVFFGKWPFFNGETNLTLLCENLREPYFQTNSDSSCEDETCGTGWVMLLTTCMVCPEYG